MDLSQLQKVKTDAELNSELNSELKRGKAIQYLQSTDWYVIRQVETGKVIPEEIRTARQAARDELV